jgi:hypothetical protein
MYAIHMGIPEMEKFWEELQRKVKSEKATKKDEKLYKQLGKAMRLLSENPRHPGLRTHEIDALTARYGIKVWESYLENNTPGAGRMFWVYGPDVGDITIIGLEPHPNDKSNAYKKITLSQMGKEID